MTRSMRRVRGLGTTSSSITSGAPLQRSFPTSTSATGSRGRPACSTRSATVRSSGSGPPDGSDSPKRSSRPSLPQSPAPGATTPCSSRGAARTARRAARSSTSSSDTALARVFRSLAAFAASLSLVASPLAAQDASDRELRELIPDSAVEDPETWAGQGVPPEEAAAAEAVGDLQPDSPLAETPLIDIPWPDQVELPPIEPLAPEPGIEFADFDLELPRVEMGAEERISDELVLVFPRERALFPQHDEFLDRFRALSTIEDLD